MTSPPYRRQGVAFRAFFRLDTASGLFGVEFPDLPGCVASGGDFVQARDDAKHALDLGPAPHEYQQVEADVDQTRMDLGRGQRRQQRRDRSPRHRNAAQPRRDEAQRKRCLLVDAARGRDQQRERGA